MLSQYQIQENSIEQELLNAIENEDINLSDTLIHNGAKLNRVDDEWNTILMRKKVISETMLTFLLSKAEEQNGLYILKIKNKKSQSIFDFYLTPEGLPLLKFLLTNKNYSEYLPSLRDFPFF